MPPIKLYDQHLIVDPDLHLVVNPDRATETFSAEAVSQSKLWFVFGAVFAAVALLLWFAFLSEVLPRMPSIIDALDLSQTIKLLLFLGVLFGAPLLSALMFRWALDLKRRASQAPKRETPEDTVQTYFHAIANSLYSRAYNCLTDSGQTASFSGPRLDSLQRLMPDVDFNSLPSFQTYSRKVSFLWNPKYAEIRKEPFDSQTVKSELPFFASWKPKG